MKSVLFPATDICSIRSFPLFLATSQLVIMQGWQKEASETVDFFTKAGFCQVKCPTPFEDKEEEQRFQQLLGELAARGGESAALFSSLTLAARTADSGSERESAILSTLAGGRVEVTPEQAARWQARLVLALGEGVDREQEEIAAALARIDDSTRTLLEELQGEEDEEESLLEELRQVQSHLTTNRQAMEGRAEAWWQLFAGTVEEESLLVTDNQDAADWLSNRYEAKGEVQNVGTLALPALLGRSAEEAVERLQGFRAGEKNAAAVLERWLQEGGVLEEWEAALERRFPAGMYGRKRGELLRLSSGATTHTGSLLLLMFP